MRDPLPTDAPRALDGAPDADRTAKIEQLLLAGLERYFAAEYEQAINVWTRALFLDRTHARARAYIELARGALAERQRESEELLQRGVAAFERGEGEEARRLLQTAMSRGAPLDEALAVLDRIDRLELSVASHPPPGVLRVPPARVQPHPPRAIATGALRLLGWAVVALGAVAAGALALLSARPDLRSLAPRAALPATVAAPVEATTTLPLPRRGEDLLDRARALEASGRLREALATLEQVRPTDDEREDAERMRASIQRQLIALIAPPGPPADPEGQRLREP
jgi:tetratricopeptide (TPR) repeat protein